MRLFRAQTTFDLICPGPFERFTTPPPLRHRASLPWAHHMFPCRIGFSVPMQSCWAASLQPDHHSNAHAPPPQGDAPTRFPRWVWTTETSSRHSEPGWRDAGGFNDVPGQGRSPAENARKKLQKARKQAGHEFLSSGAFVRARSRLVSSPSFRCFRSWLLGLVLSFILFTSWCSRSLRCCGCGALAHHVAEIMVLSVITPLRRWCFRSSRCWDHGAHVHYASEVMVPSFIAVLSFGAVR